MAKRQYAVRKKREYWPKQKEEGAKWKNRRKANNEPYKGRK